MFTPLETTRTSITSSQEKLIEYQNITVNHNGCVVLNNINLSISLGENIAILGPNGAGKSFFIKTITREKYPTRAQNSYIRILGKEIWNIFDLRSQLGIVSSDITKIHTIDISARETILSGFFNSTDVWSYHITREMEKKTREIIEQLEITHLSSRKMDQLSSGEVQRILIGRALVHNPRALVLDEPCASLDFRVAHELRDKLSKITNMGTSIVMVTHNLTDIIPEITRVILLKNGAVFGDGAKEKMLTPESLQRLYGIPLKVIKSEGYYHIL